MKANLRVKAVFVLVFISTLLIPSIVFKVDAQEEIQTTSGISVSPIRVQRNYKGNDKDIIKFTLLNSEEEEATLSVTIKSFKLLNNNTDISFDPTIEETVLNWIRNFDNSVTLKPKERAEYELKLNIDPATKPGGYLFGIFFESVGSNSIDQNGASVKQSIGVPLIVNVAGVEGISYGDISLDTFDVLYNFISNNLHFNVVILNNSNQIIIPSGLVTIKKEFGIGPEDLNSAFNAQGKIINSFSLRAFDKDIYFNQLVLGRYQVSLDFLYGLENNVYSQKTTVWVIPIWSVAAVVLGVVILIRRFRNKKIKNEEDSD